MVRLGGGGGGGGGGDPGRGTVCEREVWRGCVVWGAVHGVDDG